MRSVTYRLVDLQLVEINLGFVGENKHTKIIFDCKKMFDQYPNAIVSLSVTPPQGDVYPVVTTREGDFVFWEVTASDLVYDGAGKIQLTFIENDKIAKTYECKTRINPSSIPVGNPPSAVQNFVDQANTVLQQLQNALQNGGQGSVGQGSGGSHETPSPVIDDNAGQGDLAKTWSADKILQTISDKFSEMIDEINFITSEADPTVPSWAKQPNKPSYTAQEVGALPADTSIPDVSGKADKSNTVLTDTVSKGRTSGSTVGNGSIGYGTNVVASGTDSVALGDNTQATGQLAHAKGRYTYASNTAANSEGLGTTASGEYSHAEGTGTQSSASNSHAEGIGSAAQGVASHAEGQGTTTSGGFAHAEGQGTIASGNSSHAEGGGSKSIGNISHAEGGMTQAIGHGSHSQGNQTIADGDYSNVSGAFNVRDNLSHRPVWQPYNDYNVDDRVRVWNEETESFDGYICTDPNSDSEFDPDKWAPDNRMKYVEIVGNGNKNVPSNARSLDWQGNEHLFGTLYTECNFDGSGGVKVATENQLPIYATNAETMMIFADE